LYPNPLHTRLYAYFYEQAKKAKKLFFPPFTPLEILKHYGDKAVQVPLIVRNQVQHKQWPDTGGRRKILIMDSGAGLMKDSILRAFSDKELEKSMFYFGTSYDLPIENNFRIPPSDLLVDYVKDADLVIGRPGFNTISECLAARTPLLLISEAMNPEMEHNIIELLKERLGAFMSLAEFESDLDSALRSFFDREYEILLDNTRKHIIETNGAEVIAKEILDYVS
jgi:UDP:flavonoid glycosyltransferase YjiC (YdhE family)